MTEIKFSSNRQSGTQPGKGILGSLALRILTICAVLLVIPLLFHSLVLFRQEYRLKVRDLFTDLEIVAKEQQSLLDQIIVERLEHLGALQLLLGSNPGTELLQKISQEEHLSSLSIIDFIGTDNTLYKASSQANLIGKTGQFVSQMQAAKMKGSTVFAAPDSEQIQLYIGKYGTDGILLMSIPVQDLLQKLSSFKNNRHLSFQLSLLSEGKVIATTSSVAVTEVVTPLDFEKTNPYFHFTLHNFIKEKQNVPIGIQVPIDASSLSLLVTFSSQEISQIPMHRSVSFLPTLLMLIFVLGGACTWLFVRRMAKPLNHLTDLMNRVAKGDLEARYRQDPFGFEINILGSHFNQMVGSLILHIEEAKSERIAKEVLQSELKIGHEIQKSILPQKMPDFPGLECASGFLAAQEVAGDFYDFFVRESKAHPQLLFSIADASGKGISACLYSLCMRSMLRSYDTAFDDLSSIVRASNNLFCLDTADTGNFVTAWLGLYDAPTKKLNYVSAGHCPAILLKKNGEIEELTTDGMALGVTPFDKVEHASMHLETGDVLILYTDGVVEAHNPSLQLFGKHRFLDVIKKLNTTNSAQSLVDQIINEVKTFAAGSDQYDDLTLLVIRVVSA